MNTFPINRHSRASIGVALLALLLVAACSTPPGPPTLLSAPPSPVAPSIPAPTPAAPASLACDGPADFAAAARFNAAAETSLLVAPFGRNEMGWGAYGPLAAATLQTPCASDSPGFAKALAAWEGAHGLVASGALDAAALQTFKGIWQERRPFVMLRLADVCPPPPADADLETLAPQETAGGDKPVQLRKTTAAALRRMVAAARAEEPALTADPLLLTVFSGYRSPAYDAARCASENNCQGLVRASCSAHRTGLAVDLDVGSEPGFPLDASVDSNRLAQTNGPAYRWLVRNAGRFGFVNYAFEPWHWEWTGEAP